LRRPSFEFTAWETGRDVNLRHLNPQTREFSIGTDRDDDDRGDDDDDDRDRDGDD
jgi:hypothetical protein